MLIATASLNQTPLDWNRNADNIRQTVDAVRKQGTMILCLPELCISGAGCGEYFRHKNVSDKALDVFFELLPDLGGMIVTLGLPLEYEGHLLNTVCLVVDGKPFGFQCKTAYSETNFHELARFRPWAKHRHVPFELNGQTYKLGDCSFEFKLNETKTFHVAVEVGEPDWSHPVAAAVHEHRKLDLLLNPAASPFTLGKHAKRLDYARRCTEDFGYAYAFANLLGNESGPLIFDGGSFAAEKGRIVAESTRFSFGDAQITFGTLDADAPEKSGAAASREDELARAVPLGLFDYLRKSGTKGFVLSLSGGADSAAVAVFVRLGVLFGAAELGLDGFKERFDFVPNIEAAAATEEIVRRLLLCVYQGTQNSTPTTLKAAQTVADEIGAEFMQLNIDPLVQHYVAMIERAVGRSLSWETDDLALQNIQARTRGPGVWMLANLRSALLLATGNRSEAGVGYATMDGDTCGSLAPIGGIDKNFLRRFLLWLEKTGPNIGGVPHPMPFLSVVNAQVPTAELKPAACGQTDEADLMPYDVLHRIELLGFFERKKIDEILETLCKEFPDHSAERLAEWIDTFFRLWNCNQWKRRRYAMSFRLDDSALDGTYPLLSGR